MQAIFTFFRNSNFPSPNPALPNSLPPHQKHRKSASLLTPTFMSVSKKKFVRYILISSLTHAPDPIKIPPPKISTPCPTASSAEVQQHSTCCPGPSHTRSATHGYHMTVQRQSFSRVSINIPRMSAALAPGVFRVWSLGSIIRHLYGLPFYEPSSTG